MPKFSLQMLVIYAEKLGQHTEIKAMKARSRGAASSLARTGVRPSPPGFSNGPPPGLKIEKGLVPSLTVASERSNCRGKGRGPLDLGH